MAGRHEFKLENGTTFYIRRYDAFLSLKILGDVQKKFLAPLALFIEANDRSLPQDTREKNMMEAIQKISLSLDGDSLVELTQKVLNKEYISCSIGGNPPDKLDEGVLNRAVESVFDTVALVFEVLRYNYEELFTRGRSLFGNIQIPQTEAIH